MWESAKKQNFQRQGIEIAKKAENFKGSPIQYWPEAKGKDKVVYDKVIELLKENTRVLDISKETGVTRNTIYKIASISDFNWYHPKFKLSFG